MRSLYRGRKTALDDSVHNDFYYPDLSEADTVIFHTHNGEPQEGPSPLETKEMQIQEMLEAAQQEAEEIRRQAYEDGYAAGREDGYKAGVLEGLSEGRTAYRKRCTSIERQIAEYIESVETAKEKLLETYMDDLKEIALVIGEKIVRTSLRSNSQVVERMILAATEKLRKTSWAKIYIGYSQEAPIDVQGDAKFLRELNHLSDHVKIIMMEGKEPGTCIVEMPDEIIDVSVGTQLENIREIMNNARL